MKARYGMSALALVLAIVALPGCQGVVTNGNGPAGPERIEWGPPWRVAPPARATVKGADGCDTCEGDACKLPRR